MSCSATNNWAVGVNLQQAPPQIGKIQHHQRLIQADHQPICPQIVHLEQNPTLNFVMHLLVLDVLCAALVASGAHS